MADIQKMNRVSSKPEDLTGKYKVGESLTHKAALYFCTQRTAKKTGHNGFCLALGGRHTLAICMVLKCMGNIGKADASPSNMFHVISLYWKSLGIFKYLPVSRIFQKNTVGTQRYIAERWKRTLERHRGEPFSRLVGTKPQNTVNYVKLAQHAVSVAWLFASDEKSVH